MASIYYVVPAIVICYATICVLGNVASLFKVFNLYQTVGPPSNKISPPRGAATRYAQRRRQLAVEKIAADLRPSADVSAVRTSLVAGGGSAAGSEHANIPRQLRHGTDRQTDGSRYRLMPLLLGGGKITLSNSAVAERPRDPLYRYYSATGREAKYCDERVCLSVCFVCLCVCERFSKNTRPIVTECYVCYTQSWLGPSLAALRYVTYFLFYIIKATVAHTRLPSVRFRSRFWFLAVSLQVT